MSIIIKGMEMPGHCYRCPLRDNGDDHCVLQPESVETDSWGIQMEHCPLVHIPEKHGRLGDLDAIIKSLNKLEADFEKKEFFQGACWVHVIAELLKKAPAIIPAEGGTDNG